MKREGIKQEDFSLPRSPELAVTGSQRQILLVPKGMKTIDVKEDDFNPGKMKAVISFELPPGAYATVVLTEVMKNENE